MSAQPREIKHAFAQTQGRFTRNPVHQEQKFRFVPAQLYAEEPGAGYRISRNRSIEKYRARRAFLLRKFQLESPPFSTRELSVFVICIDTLCPRAHATWKVSKSNAYLASNGWRCSSHPSLYADF